MKKLSIILSVIVFVSCAKSNVLNPYGANNAPSTNAKFDTPYYKQNIVIDDTPYKKNSVVFSNDGLMPVMESNTRVGDTPYLPNNPTAPLDTPYRR